MDEVWASLLVARTVSLDAERYRLARDGTPAQVRPMMDRATRLLRSNGWLQEACIAYFANTPGPARPILDVDLAYWEDWWMPDGVPKPAVTLDMFAAPAPATAEVDLTDPNAVLDAYFRILGEHKINPPTTITLDDALETVRTGRPAGVKPKAKARKNSDELFRAESDRILRTANAPKVAPGQSWTDGCGAVRYTSWAWIPETNRWSHQLAVSLGIFVADDRGKTRYVGEDHLYGLDQPDHPLHQTWVRERRAYLDLVGVADEYTVTL